MRQRPLNSDLGQLHMAKMWFLGLFQSVRCVCLREFHRRHRECVPAVVLFSPKFELGDEGWRTFAARAERTSPVLVCAALEKESVFSDHP